MVDMAYFTSSAHNQRYNRCDFKKKNHHTRLLKQKTSRVCASANSLSCACVTECVDYSSLCVLESLGRFMMSGATMPEQPVRCYCGNILIVLIN